MLGNLNRMANGTIASFHVPSSANSRRCFTKQHRTEWRCSVSEAPSAAARDGRCACLTLRMPPFLLLSVGGSCNIPCQEPPYGKIGVVDLTTHSLSGSQPLGSALRIIMRAHSASAPLAPCFRCAFSNIWARRSFRGQGLVFASSQSTQNARYRIRAQDGTLLCELPLPRGGIATHMSATQLPGPAAIYRDATPGGQACSFGSMSGDYVTVHLPCLPATEGRAYRVSDSDSSPALDSPCHSGLGSQPQSVPIGPPCARRSGVVIMC